MPRGGPRAGFGGKQPGAGRPRTRLVLDKDTAKALALLTRIQRQFAPGTTEEMIVANLVADAAAETMDDYARRADTTTEAQ